MSEKKDSGTIIASIGMLFSIFGMTIFESNKTLQYIALGLGVAFTIYGTYKADKERKAKAHKNEN
ncbi:hypothetical protein [Aquimarina sp. 2201CG5-10]|uniref:hypothetical protein n=1 Tax=Aquimarina callyspongiae TaxID=3098150 RepID=UPI002AB33C06|nr:hypothetical protein [Aquimarina sp. 2201CG5-10]MDY8136341.1 hypothetical protein [Aquimarina sp. 2201CG5-10]